MTAVQPATPPLLEARHIWRSFGGVQALGDVSISVFAGEVHAICGENGAGKSTLMKIIAGADQPDRGELWVNGQLTQLSGSRAGARNGIAMIYQELHLTPQLSVAENIFAGRLPRRAGVLVDWRRLFSQADEVLQRVGATFSAQSRVEELSIAHRQLVEIAKALVSDARLLVLDEPTASLSKLETETLLKIIADLRSSGTAVLYVSHRLDEVFQIADRITVLRDGNLVATTARDRTAPDAIVRQMVGRDVQFDTGPPPFQPDRVRLEISGLTSPGVFRDASFTVAAGEIVGLWGLIGAGRTELARAIYGLDNYATGSVKVDGQALVAHRPWRSRAAGLAYVSEDRKGLGLVLGHDVETNLALPNLSDFSRIGFVRSRARKQMAQKLVDRLDVRPPDVTRIARQLSGGNQQKVCLAKWLARESAVLMLDEPTRGVDIGAKAEIHSIVRDLARSGLAILLISSELPEVMGLTHRVLVMREGRIVGHFARADATEEKLLGLVTSDLVSSGPEFAGGP